MHRNDLRNLLLKYETTWGSRADGFLAENYDEEREHIARMRKFIDESPQAFERTNLAGHITGSALIVDPARERVLLTLHGKLNKWLQLGGHCDGNPRVEETALREGVEESGLTSLRYLPFESHFGLKEHPLIFDLDVHLIPARKQDPEHFHYDVRFLIVADEPDSLKISDESQDLAWHRLDEAYQITSERSMHRQFDKLRYLNASRAK